MKTGLLLLCGLLLTTSTGFADPHHEGESCPAHRAANAGHVEFEAFHVTMAEAWHIAWPEKDYAALIAAGPVFAEKLGPIMEMRPEFKSTDRYDLFLHKREQFASKVHAYAAAAEAGDSMKVYDLMPELHDWFEWTAAALLPIYFPAIEGIVVTVNVIKANHLPKTNVSGLVGSAETLATKVTALNKEAIPWQLAADEEAILAVFEEIRGGAKIVSAAADAEDWTTYETAITDLSAILDAFVMKYIDIHES